MCAFLSSAHFLHGRGTVSGRRRAEGRDCSRRRKVRASLGDGIAQRLGGFLAATVLGGGGVPFSASNAAREIQIREFHREQTELVASNAPLLEAEILDDADVSKAEAKANLRSRRIVTFAPAQEEILDLDREWEQLWYIRFLQYALVICVVPAVGLSAAGLGKLFEAWTKAQEEAEREEEIKLTGSYSSPATVRKEQSGDDKKGGDGSSASDGKGGEGEGGGGGDKKDGDGGSSEDGTREALERMFGKS